jgi:hypothetical protein
MTYKKQHQWSYDIINSFLLYNHGKAGTILNYKVPSVCQKAKRYKRDAKADTSQREQYGGTVHLFIGTGHNLWEITVMPFTFTIGL